jgi:hypothetical protein
MTSAGQMKTTTAVVLSILILLAAAAVPLQATTIFFNNLPTPVPPNSPSIGFQATQAEEFGDFVQLAGGPQVLSSGIVLMSDWAKNSDYPSMGAGGWNYPLTLTLYNVDSSSGTAEPGTVITSVTQSMLIPWRPADDPTNCPGGGYLGSDAKCHSGFNFEAIFNLPNVSTPGQFIWGISFNTQTYGPNPTGVAGPYISLNVSVTPTISPSVGSRPVSDSAYFDSITAGQYCDNGAGGTGTFRQDRPWDAACNGAAYMPAAEFSGVLTGAPEPGSVGLMGLGGIVIGGVLVRRRRQKS